MHIQRSLTLRILSLVLFASMVAAAAFGQAQTGNIYGTVVSNDGSALPGVTVALTGVGAPQTVITDAQGRFRFLNLSPGSYSLKADLAGFGSTIRSGISVNIGRNSDATLTLAPSMADTITVTADSPLLDVRKTGTGGTITEVELEQVPSARDPWVILQQVPGVLMDRMNIGGNESGQQSNFASKGSSLDQASFSVDGVTTTDMVATGSSSDYFDFGSFEEIQVATGGTDPRVQTPGAQINIVTRRGTNDYKGSARYYLTGGGSQGSRKIPAEARPYLGKTNEINEVSEWGGEVGGPVLRDRLWFWAAYAENDIQLFTAQSQNSINAGQQRYADNTKLETVNAKLNAQVTTNNSLTLFYSDNEKIKLGRNTSPSRPPEAAWNQSDFGPKGTYKIEDTQIFSSRLYVTGLYSKVHGGFQLQPDTGAGCLTLDCVLENADKATTADVASGVFRNTYLAVQGERNQEQYRGDASAFFDTGALNHELKFGFGYRTVGAEGISVWPQNQLIYDQSNLPGAQPGIGVTYFFAIGPYNYKHEYQDFYVGDTILAGNLTVQAGLRYDVQSVAAGDQVAPANSVVPEFLPSLTVPGDAIPDMEWTSISPRIGLTYALGQDKRTLLRAAYNRYVGPLGSNSTGYTSMITGGSRYVAFYTHDVDRNDLITREEILDFNPYAFSGFDPANPSSISFTRRVADGIEAPTTNEFILGAERELFANFVASATFTHRQFDNFLWFRPEKTAGGGDWYTPADYELLTTVTRPNPAPGSSTPPANEVGAYNEPVYRLKAGIAAPTFFALTNRDGYSQTYNGLELAVVKRLANRWMLRGNVSLQDWVQNVDEEATFDPTRRSDLGSSIYPSAVGCDTCDGGEVAVPVGNVSGAKGGVWINAKWSLNLNGMYQIPWIETNLGAAFTMRQGYPIVYTHSVGVPGEGAKAVVIGDIGDHRLPNPYSLDLRLAKTFALPMVGLEVAFDVFNVTNYQPVLQRTAGIASGTGLTSGHNRITELQNPRVMRLGARLTF